MSIIKKFITWVLVADVKKAHIYKQHKKGHIPELHHTLTSTNTIDEGTKQDLGRVFNANGAKSIMEPHTDGKMVEIQEFVGDINQYLKAEDSQDTFDRLILVAPPKLLGQMRKSMDSHVREKVVSELDKDLTRLPARDLQKHLQDTAYF